MAQQDEVSGLRDIIRHDQVMDAQALEKLASLKQAVGTSGILDAEIVKRLEDIERDITSTLAEASKNAGVVTSIQLVLADRPE